MAKKRSTQGDGTVITRKGSSVQKKRERAPAKSGDKTKESSSTSVGVRSKKCSPSTPSASLDSFHIFSCVIFFLAGVATRPLLSLWKDRGLASRKLSTDTSFGQQEGTNTDDISIRDQARSGDKSIEHFPHYFACDDVNLLEFMHATPQQGIHVVCLREDSANHVSLRMFRGAHNGSQTEPIESEAVWGTIRKLLETDLSLPQSGTLQQPWAIFTPQGERLVGADDRITDEEIVLSSLFRAGMVIIMEGGSWIWPGVRVGFKREIDLYSIMPGSRSGEVVEGRKATIETLSLRPLVVSVKGFISKDECKHIQEVSSPTLRYSGVSLMDHDKGKPASEWRTSQSTFLPSGKDKIIRDLEKRTASLTRIPITHQEHVQVLRYGNQEKYDAHHDYFNPAMYRNDAHTMRQIQNGKRNRLATVFWYLSDVEKGGETIFPRHNGAPQPTDFSDCSRGLKVRPEEGKVIIFYSLDAAGRLDPLSLHGACKVEEGIKWAANKWVWNAPRDYVSDD